MPADRRPASRLLFLCLLAACSAVSATALEPPAIADCDMPGIARDGMSITPEHIKDGDARVIAHSKMIGGGESASVTFDVSKLKAGGPYKFFCSFPGHLALMQGNIAVQ